MKNGIMKRALSTVVAGFLAITSSPFAAKTSIEADAAKVLTTSPGHTQETGWYNDYHHEIWQADTPNSSTMTLADDGGGFSTSWKCGPNGSRGNFLARRGLFYGRNTGKHWQDHGNFTCDFDCEWSAGSAGNSRICIYGWTENPLVEFYIIEDWKNWVPSSSSAKQITVDGSVYDVFTNQMNSYNITNSNGPFTQYISVRKTPRTSGRISIYKHFEAWESLGMKMGDFYEVAFNVEGWESDGQANVKKNIIKTNGGGEETTTSEPATAPEPDKDGNYLAEGFESGKGSFTGRGDATVSVDTENYYDGKSSLKISGRTKNWHGGAIKLDSSTFVPGNTYSISAAALQKSGSTKDLKLTLEYTAGDQDWKEVASADAKSGEWTKLENTEFTIPSGASSMTLYIESSDETLDIFLDSVQIAKKGKSSNVKTGGGTVDGSTSSTITTTKTTETTASASGLPAGVLLGDANCDKLINIADAVLVMQVATNPDKYDVGKSSSSISEMGAINGDVDGSKGLTNKDALTIQKYKLGLIKEFDSPYKGEQTTQTTSKVVTQQTTTTTVITTTPNYNGNYMKTIQLQSNAPSGFDQKKGGVDYGTMEKVTYYSKAASGNKQMNVILPPGYNKNEKYPVLYALHGIGGTEDSMPGMGVQAMLGNAIAEGISEKMIIVCPDMLTGPGSRMGFDQQSMRSYDKVREDIIESIMPYMEEHYSVKTGRDNTAISGFSLGGREALYTGVTKSEYFGYIGAACPAPGIFPTTDYIMTHEGSLKNEKDFVPSTKPYMLFISSGGDTDSVVKGYPESYDKALTSNGVEHLFQHIVGGGHDNSTVTPHFYNFLKYVFKAA